MSDAADVDALRAELDGLEDRPVAEHADVLESLHGRLAGELDGLVIPRGETRAQ